MTDPKLQEYFGLSIYLYLNISDILTNGLKDFNTSTICTKTYAYAE